MGKSERRTDAPIYPRMSGADDGANVRRQFAHPCFLRIPRAHEPRATASDKGIEAPALGPQRLQRGFRHLQEHAVGLHREHQLHTRQVAHQRGQQLRAVIGMAAIAQPGAVFEQPDPGRGEKTHLRRQLARLLAAVVEVIGQGAIEEQDRFAHGHAVLGAAEAQHIHPGLPGQLRWRAAQGGTGVGEACAIHVQVQPQLLAGGADRLELVGVVHRAHFGGLGDGHHAWLGVVDVLALEGHLADRLGGQLAVDAAGGEQLGAVGKELRRTALVGFDVGGLGADDAVIALAQRGQGQGVGGSAVEGEEHLAVGLEQLAEVLGGPFGPLIVAIGALVALVGLLHRGPGFGADAGIVVAGELLAVISHDTCPFYDADRHSKPSIQRLPIQGLCEPLHVLILRASSRASPLPQGLHSPCGSGLTRKGGRTRTTQMRMS